MNGVCFIFLGEPKKLSEKLHTAFLQSVGQQTVAFSVISSLPWTPALSESSRRCPVGIMQLGDKGEFRNQHRGKPSCGGGWDDACTRTRHLVRRSTNISFNRSCMYHEETWLRILSVLCHLYPFPVNTYPTSHLTSVKNNIKSAIKPSVSTEMPTEGWNKHAPGYLYLHACSSIT